MYSANEDFLDEVEIEQCARAAQEFIDDWDNGVIKPHELPYVLGLVDWPQTVRAIP
jgi:hypothetical protein